MRLSVTLLAVIAFLLAGVFSALAARVAVGAVEERSVEAVQEQLSLEGFDWATVLGDGLQVIIEGEAPTEAARFRAMSIAGGMVDASRVIDNMRVTDTAGIAAPAFAIEILRNDSGVSLIGLIPATTDREALSAEIARIAGGAPVTDLLQAADYPVPAAWRPSLAFALDALGRLPRSKISVEAGHVAVTAISDSVNEQRRIESDLARSVPDGVTLALSVSAPRPVISPFTVRFAIDDRGARFDACAADSEAERDMILAAAVAAGAEGRLDCTLALGVPTRRWGQAVAMAIAALDEIGGGTVTFSDADVVLVAAEGTQAAAFNRVVGELSNALPDVFALEAVLPVAPDASAEGPPEFTATLSPEGMAQIRGRVHDPLMNETVANFARAQFGADAVTMGTRVAGEGLPMGWSVRVLAGIEALSWLANGAVTVTPDRVVVTGQTGNADARDQITRLFIDKLGQQAQFEIDVAYVEALDPIAGLPTPEECVNQIRVVTEGRKITFEPGSATLNADAVPIIDDIAEVLRLCGDLRLRISGFTDSQGRDEMNLNLSQDRAGAVLDALRMRRVPVASFEAVGYGEANPIADNETEEGREANRRIEFSLIVPEGVEIPTTLEGLEAAPDAAVGAGPDAPQVVTLTVTPVPDYPFETRPRARSEDRPDLSLGPVGEAEPEPEAAPDAGAVPDAVPDGAAAPGSGEAEDVPGATSDAGTPEADLPAAVAGPEAANAGDAQLTLVPPDPVQADVDAAVPVAGSAVTDVAEAAVDATGTATPEAAATDAPATATDAGEAPAGETAEPVSPDAVEPDAGVVEPAVDAEELPVDVAEPAADTAAPPADVAEPAAEVAEPTANVAEPAADVAAPPTDPGEPPADAAEPTAQVPFVNAMEAPPETRPVARPAGE
jgi:OOP family OmpA-OmpF porin